MRRRCKGRLVVGAMAVRRVKIKAYTARGRPLARRDVIHNAPVDKVVGDVAYEVAIDGLAGGAEDVEPKMMGDIGQKCRNHPLGQHGLLCVEDGMLDVQSRRKRRKARVDGRGTRRKELQQRRFQRAFEFDLVIKDARWIEQRDFDKLFSC